MDLIGRETELARLLAWIDSPPPVSVRVLTGGGGRGKTRLRAELIDRLPTAPDPWQGGFLDHAFLERIADYAACGMLSWDQPTLLVVDYPAVAADTLGKLFENLEPHEGAPRLRVLLLERHADPDEPTGWWRRAFPITSSALTGTDSTLDLPRRPEPLAALPAPDARTVLNGMLTRIGSPLRVSEEAYESIIRPQVKVGGWAGDPLYLMIAALWMHHAGTTVIVTLNRFDLARFVAEKEQRRIRRIAEASSPPIPPALLFHLVAFVTLCGGLPDDSALFDRLRAEMRHEGFDAGANPRDLADALRSILGPAERDMFPPLPPDAVGEAFLLDVWRSRSLNKAVELVERALEMGEARVAAVMIRTIRDFGDDAEIVLRWIDALAGSESITLQALMCLSDQMSSLPSVLMRPIALIIGQSLERRSRTQVDAHNIATLVLHAASLSNLGSHLSAAGRRAEALGPAQEAVEIRRELAARNRDAFLPDFANSCGALGTAFLANDNFSKAMDAFRDGISAISSPWLLTHTPLRN